MRLGACLVLGALCLVGDAAAQQMPPAFAAVAGHRHGGGGASIDPTTLNGLYAYFDASSTTNMVLADSLVTRWIDRGSGGNDFTQTGNPRPFVVTVNGRFGIYTGGNYDRWMYSDLDFNGLAAYTVFLVAFPSAGDDASVTSYDGTTSGGSFIMFQQVEHCARFGGRTPLKAELWQISVASVSASGGLAVGRYSSGAAKVYTDGGLSTSTTITAGASIAVNGTYLGRLVSTDNTDAYEGLYCEYIVYTNALSDAQVNGVSVWLCDKWDIE